MPVQVARVACGEENTVQRFFGNQRSFVPANDFYWRVAAIVAALMRPMALAIVVLDPFAVNLLHVLPTPGLMEVKVSHSPDDIDYVELPLVALKKVRGIERQVHIMQVM